VEISQLLDMPNESRNETWEKQFFAEFPKSVVKIDKPIPSQEYDGWPYLHVSSTDGSGEPAIKVIEWLSERGIGLVLNSNKSAPDYVFSYGMLWSYRLRGHFIGDLNKRSEGSYDFDLKKYKKIGTPSENIFPPYARKIVKQFFIDQSILAPKILVMSESDQDFDLCFSLESLGYPPEKEHKGILEALAWFFPADYSLALLSESAVNGFTLI